MTESKNGLTTALILEGGGCKGAFEAGIIQYIHEKKIKIDFVGGTSVGGLNAACFAFGKIQELIDLWSNISNEKVYSPGNFLKVIDALKPEEIEDFQKLIDNLRQHKFGGGLLDLIDIAKDLLRQALLPPEFIALILEIISNLLKKGSVFDNVPLQQICEKLFQQKKVTEGTNPKLFLTAFQLQSAQEIYFGNDKKNGDLDGTVVDVLMATSAIQGIFPVKEIDGKQYIDGGNGANLPLSYAVNHDCERIILARDNQADNQSPEIYRNPIGILLRAYLASFTNTTKRDINFTDDISKRIGILEDDLKLLNQFSSQIADQETQSKYLSMIKILKPVFEHKKKIKLIPIIPDWTPSNIVDFNAEASKRLIQAGYAKAADALKEI